MTQRNYESKQYKKGLKACEQILKKYPQHGETTSMKGLILNSLGSTRKAEARDLSKKGLRYDLTSHICWHVLGMVYRSDRNYEEALKCCQHAIKFDKENLNILRDMSVLQMQCRLYEAYTVIFSLEKLELTEGNEVEIIAGETWNSTELDCTGSGTSSSRRSCPRRPNSRHL